MSDVASGGVAAKAGVKDHDRLVELNGDNVEECTHEQVVDKIKMSGSDITFLLVDEETDKDYKNKRGKIQAHQATTKYLNPDPRVIKITRGADGYGFLLREEPDHTGRGTDYFFFFFKAAFKSTSTSWAVLLMLCLPLNVQVTSSTT